MVRAYVAVALVAAALAGCSESGDSGGSATISGSATVAGLPTPTPPAYAPLYPGAVLEASEPTPASSGATVTFHTAAKPAEVIAFYRRATQAAGLDSTFASQSGEDELFSAGRQGSDDGMQVIVTPADGGASVQLFWTGPKRG
jgi:hypothetical protein